MSPDKTRTFGTPPGDAQAPAAEDKVVGAAPPMTSRVAEGDVLDGKYRVDRVLAAGGMGVVVAAHHLKLDERVAIKFLRDEILADAEQVARFAREARTAIKIKSEHIARIIDVGALANGAPYMVMEYLEGEDLAGYIRSKGALPVEQAVEFVLQACEAISEAHALGIVHRDLKPANLFVTRRADGIFAVKVLDFGISKIARGSTSADTTRKNLALGSPSYMSPEQLAAPSTVDARADIWALGITLFEMLTGEMPFFAESTPLVCGKILRDPPRPVRDIRPEVPEGVQLILLRCLEKEPNARYANLGELALALAPFAPERAQASAQRVLRTVEAAGMSVRASAHPSWQPGTSSNPATRVVWDQSTGSPRPKGVWVRGIMISVLVATLALACALVWRALARPSAIAESAQAPKVVAPPAPDPEPPAPPSLSAQIIAPVEEPPASPTTAPAKPPAKRPRVAPPSTKSATAPAQRPKSTSVFDERN